MFEHLTRAAVVAAALTVTPAAQAAPGGAPVQVTCVLAAAAQGDVTGTAPLYNGAALGVALFDDGQPHTLRCYVTVDGFEQMSTPTGAGNDLVTTAGQVTYFAPEGAVVDVCAETDGILPSGADTTCWPVAETQVPAEQAQDVTDEVAAALLGPADPVLDSALCPVLATLAPGVPGVVDVGRDGDTTVLGQPVRECPPYGGPHGTRVPGPVRLQTRLA
jgi:hypothetical protein